MWKSNQYDPESLLTGAEAEAGLTYDNSQRVWPSEQAYQAAANGEYTAEMIAMIAPRQKGAI